MSSQILQNFNTITWKLLLIKQQMDHTFCLPAAELFCWHMIWLVWKFWTPWFSISYKLVFNYKNVDCFVNALYLELLCQFNSNLMVRSISMQWVDNWTQPNNRRLSSFQWTYRILSAGIIPKLVETQQTRTVINKLALIKSWNTFQDRTDEHSA